MSWTHEKSWPIEAPPARVFAALTQPEELTRWFAEHAEVEPRAGGRYRFWGRHTLETPSAAQARQTITRFEADTSLAYTWQIHGVPTEVTISVAAEKEGSRLTVKHLVSGPLPVTRPKELVEDHWHLAAGNLMSHLAGGSGLMRPDFADPKPEVRLSITIDAPREAVFRALIEPEQLANWFALDPKAPITVEPRVGGRYDLNWSYKHDGKDVHGGPTIIKEFVPNERLVLDWTDWRGDASVNTQWIGFYLESVAGGTKVNFVHGGFGRATDIGDYGFGWRGFLDNLKESVRVGKNKS